MELEVSGGGDQKGGYGAGLATEGRGLRIKLRTELQVSALPNHLRSVVLLLIAHC